MLRPLFASMPFSAGNLQGTTLSHSNMMCLKWGFAKVRLMAARQEGACLDRVIDNAHIKHMHAVRYA